MTSATVRLTFPAEPEMVMLARSACSSLASCTTWLSAGRVDDVKLAVSEAVTNAVLAQRRIDPAAVLELMVSADDDELMVQVTDSAGGFEPDTHPDVIHPPDREGGRGLAIMRKFVDELRFSQTDAGTVVELWFRRRPVD